MKFFALLWIGYALLIMFTASRAKNRDALLPGKVGATAQAFAYMATYISAVALVGFGGLCYVYGMQMLLVAAGNVWLGTWFVYRYLAWPTRLWQRRYNCKTPAELLAKAYDAPALQLFIGLLSALLLTIYGSAVFKGAAVLIAGVLPVSVGTALLILAVVVGISVMAGGLRGVLYTEALQGLVMTVGVSALLLASIKAAGGPVTALKALSQLPATEAANNGFTSFSSGSAGLNILSLTLVTSVGIWAQPQLIQRHFALRSAAEGRRTAPIAMLALSLVVGGAYFASALSRLFLGPGIENPDTVMPLLVGRLLPAFGQQIFALAIVSASLSTASALLHIASGSIGRDVFKVSPGGWTWRLSVTACVAVSVLFALKTSAIIAMICSASWTLLASAVLVPYLSLLIRGNAAGGRAATLSSVGGFVSAVAWYAAGYTQASVSISGMSAPGLLGAIPPFAVGTAVSALLFISLAERPKKVPAEG